MTQRKKDSYAPDKTGMFWQLDENHEILPMTANDFVYSLGRLELEGGEEWDRQFRVDYTEVGGFIISTVFLGIGMEVNGKPPLLFETMIFDSSGDSISQHRYPTWDEAKIGHAEVVDKVLRNDL